MRHTRRDCSPSWSTKALVGAIARSGIAATLFIASGCVPRTRVVEQHGTMKEVLRDGRTEPRFDLEEIEAGSGVVAVGAMADLQGEVTILDGVAVISRVRAGALESSGAGPGDRATLLILARVEEWVGVVLDGEGPLEGAALEDAIERSAGEAGSNLANPFPFVIEGVMREADWHVINGACPMATPAGAMGDRSPWREHGGAGSAGRLVGFFARDSEGVMTHHGSRVHMHVLFRRADGVVTGHVDQVAVEAGATLRLPAAWR